jgi:predicted Zn-dependent protease
MSELEIKISPFYCGFWFISCEDSFKFGISQGVIYTFRLYSRDECDNLENGPDFYKKVAKSVDHEILHKILLDLEGYETSKKFDNIAKTQDNKEYIL